jgi:hypothetical protein
MILLSILISAIFKIFFPRGQGCQVFAGEKLEKNIKGGTKGKFSEFFFQKSKDRHIFKSEFSILMIRFLNNLNKK